MKLIVIDLDNVDLSLKDRKHLNEAKICTLLARDWGKKTLLSTKKLKPEFLKHFWRYNDAIFKVKDDDECLKHENTLFRKLFPQIRWFRVGVILRREKACKILLRLLEGQIKTGKRK